MDSRNATEFVKAHLGSDLICVEVGVRSGEHALAMLELPIKQLYLIDSYDPYLDIDEWCEASKQSEYLHDLVGRIREHTFRHKVRIILADSQAISQQFENGTLDYVYIDANHKYEAIKEDIKNWFPKIKPHGVLAGHDFHIVQQAIIEFKYEHPNYCVVLFSDTDWVIVPITTLGRG